MKRTLTKIALIFLFAAASREGKLCAQGTSVPVASNGDSGLIIIDPGVIVDKGARPPRPDKPIVPDDVKARIDQFKLVREAFLANQKDLTRKLKEATQEERDKIREQIQLQKQQFKAQAKELAQQVKESVRDLDPALGHKAGQEGSTPGRGGRPDR